MPGSSESAVATISGPPLVGVWLHDPDDPAGTLRQFMYAPPGRQERREIVSEMLEFAGRARPVAAFGETELDSLDVTLVVPHDGAWLQSVEELRSLYRRFRTYCYRDSRGRSWYGVLRGITFQDVPVGTVCTFTFDRTGFSAVPASLPPGLFTEAS